MSITASVTFILFLSVFGIVNVRGQTKNWSEPVAFNAFQYAMISYCPASWITSWNCTWCAQVSPTFQATTISYDLKSDTTVYVGYDTMQEKVVVSFRGTSEKSIDNWIYDISVNKVDFPVKGYSGLQVHAGFYNAWMDHRPHILSAARSLTTQFPSYEFLVTGHSLGAAMATLCAADLYFNEGLPGATLINFGSPRVGNSKFASLVESEFDTWRVVHDADIVPHLPAHSWGFQHVSTEIWERPSSHKHESDRYKVCDGSGEDPKCSDSLSVFSYSINDHLTYMNTDWIPCDGGPTSFTEPNSFVIVNPAPFESSIQ